MTSLKLIRIFLACSLLLAAIAWLASGTYSKSTDPNNPENVTHQSGDYIGSEGCKDCHEDQFKNFTHTAHAKLETLSSWKGKITGCEQCHGPGKAHAEEGDPKKIISFKNKSSKETSETCLGCHAGKEEHNNFRRGEHWRNDVGCTDCHTSHAPEPRPNNPGSNTFLSEAARRNVDLLAANMLRKSEPQLCISCHTETKAQFSRPFHHKVLEGQIKCSDCHNPHGGFELKQARLSTGADSACLKCHTDKQGPFVFEHAPLKVEGCSSCHTPHGAANAKLLTRSHARQLCLECHSNAHEIGAPDTPNFHNQLTLRYQNCTTCHVKIHGSHVDRFFFR
ncbi:MAG TPA: DmsE family decaheme c-type cytochrome [Pyrinomonadaceae bacterium]|nr:DmsE family decaheme c-type cytochrome [Pyrinomonadaceae bacterium]